MLSHPDVASLSMRYLFVGVSIFLLALPPEHLVADLTINMKFNVIRS